MTPAEYIEALDEPRRTQIREIDELIRKTAPELAPHVRSVLVELIQRTGTGPYAS